MSRPSREGESGPGYSFVRPPKLRNGRALPGPGDEDLLDITAWTPAAAEALHSSQVRRVRVRGWDKPTLAPLAESGAHVEKLSVGSGPDFPRKLDVSAVSRMARLRKLYIEGGVDDIDFSALSRLEEATIALPDGGGLGNLEEAAAMTNLTVGGGRVVKDLTPFANLRTLEELTLHELKLTSLRGGDRCRRLRRLVLQQLPLERLDGIAGAPRLEILFFLYLPRFRSLEGIASLPALRELELHSCRKVTDLYRIGEAAKLEHLVLESMGRIPSLDILVGLRRLRYIQMAEGTTIVDGDLSVLLTLPKLEECSIGNRKHYVPTADDIAAAVAARPKRRSRTGSRGKGDG